MSTSDAHLSIDALADLDADLLPSAEMSAAQVHLRSCEACRRTHDLLAGLPDLLAGAAAVPMPADVTARVVAAIEREQIGRAGESSGQPVVARAHPERASLRRRFGARIGAGLLGATAVFGGGYLLFSGMPGMSGGDEDAGLSSAEQAPNEVLSEGAEDRAAGSDEPPAPTTMADALAYTSAALDEQVLALIGSSGYATSGTRKPGTVIGPNGEIGEPDDVLTRCIAATKRQAGSEADPLAVHHSTFDGVEAVVIVLPEGASDAALDVWVVGASCADVSMDGTPSEVDADLDVLEHRTVRQ